MARASADHDPSAGVDDPSAGLADALARLSIDHRDVIVRAYYRGLSTHQIATELDIPEGTVKSRMHYATIALRAALEADDRTTSYREERPA